MKLTKNLASILMAASIMQTMGSPMYGSTNDLEPKDIDLEPKKPLIPKGCKEYFFNSLGDFINTNDGLYDFKCVAISDKSAIKKFNKWANETK